MKVALIFLLIALHWIALGQSSGRFSITRGVIADGGTTFSTSSRFRLGSTIAQPLASAPGSGRFSIQGGFWYRPGLQILAARKVGADFVFHFEGEPGERYIVQYADSLTSGDWQTFTNFVGDNVAKTVTQPAAGVTNRFYRVIQQ